MTWIAVVLGAVLFAGIGFVRWGMRWGSTADERDRSMPGDEYLDDGRAGRVAMTRATSIAAPPGEVWPWVAQLGRGAGWYSVDRLDNGAKTSARHLVSWIPAPQLGDASATGYVRHLDRGRCMVWWLGKAKFMGAQVRLVTCFDVSTEGSGTRLVSRISADARGVTASLALLTFCVIDSIMARAQLVGVRRRAESGPRDQSLETGAVDQYQLYEVIYANGERAGVEGQEAGAQSRQVAIVDGVLGSPSSGTE